MNPEKVFVIQGKTDKMLVCLQKEFPNEIRERVWAAANVSVLE